VIVFDHLFYFDKVTFLLVFWVYTQPQLLFYPVGMAWVLNTSNVKW